MHSDTVTVIDGQCVPNVASWLKKAPTLVLWPFLLWCEQSSAQTMIGDAPVDGDVALLASYEIPVGQRDAFEAAARSAAARTVANDGNIWLLYEEPATGEGSELASYFTVHFPDDIDELTEPATATNDLVAAAGQYRVHAELTRQVPQWSSTNALDPNKLEYAHVDYLWLKPAALADAGRVLAKRGAITRAVYGTGSDGDAATEGFVAMVAPFQVMLVLFSSQEDRSIARERLRKDLEQKGLLDEWDKLGNELRNYVTSRQTRSGKFRPLLSAAD